MTEMTKLIELLHAGNYSCVVENRYGLHTFGRRGVADLYEVYREHAEWLDHASLADKVIGKGAAALMVLGGVERVYADVISTPALTLLQEAKIAVTFGQEVPRIEIGRKPGCAHWSRLVSICGMQRRSIRLSSNLWRNSREHNRLQEHSGVEYCSAIY